MSVSLEPKPTNICKAHVCTMLAFKGLYVDFWPVTAWCDALPGPETDLVLTSWRWPRDSVHFPLKTINNILVLHTTEQMIMRECSDSLLHSWVKVQSEGLPHVLWKGRWIPMSQGLGWVRLEKILSPKFPLEESAMWTSPHLTVNFLSVGHAATHNKSQGWKH